ncbi:MAG TPA: VWA domain-containing protein [Candidatus Acidoferrum sp.]|nr:VWA domain-containing protein [Candidatus Acidoferrum sp.]
MRKQAVSRHPIPRLAAFAAVALAIVASVASIPAPAQKFPKPPKPQKPQAPTVRTEVNLVPVYFTVRDDKHALVTNLPREEFRVFEDGKEQPIDAFAHETDVPLNLGVLLDTSTRMATLRGAEADAANMFLSQVVRRNDLAFVLSFDARVNVLTEPSQELDALERGVFGIMKDSQLDPPGSIRGTAPSGTRVDPPPLPSPAKMFREAHMFDAVGLGAHRYLSHEVGRKAIVILALADDRKSETTVEQALRALQETDVIAYVLEFSHDGDDYCDIAHTFTAGPHNAERLAEETGGRVIKVKGRAKLKAAFAEIAEELHSQYYLGYYMPNPARDSRFHKIEVKTNGRGYRVQARRGYYADPIADDQ